jgi:hypothetical protein
LHSLWPGCACGKGGSSEPLLAGSGRVHRLVAPRVTDCHSFGAGTFRFLLVRVCTELLLQRRRSAARPATGWCGRSAPPPFAAVELGVLRPRVGLQQELAGLDDPVVVGEGTRPVLARAPETRGTAETAEAAPERLNPEGSAQAGRGSRKCPTVSAARTQHQPASSPPRLPQTPLIRRLSGRISFLHCFCIFYIAHDTHAALSTTLCMFLFLIV